ncbi:alpha/beta hydrolase [Sphingomonas sp.]|uniref:alpha/beta hydrolase n=1 Tax=Sphingomonas sp. TaxID=28214 RepID=UPI001EB5B5C0|nr:alpha/beta hydrolase [Sphingomonas sp.]MBX3594338.1 alpha/beta hydrolase [Sphingomonas sp.]
MIRRVAGLFLLALLAVAPTAADAQWLRERLAARGGEPSAPGMTEYAYGKDPLQKLDFWAPARASAATPVIVFVHGGGWKRGDKRDATGADKVTHYLGQGYAVASINYRLVPAATVENQASDVASAVAWLRANATRLGIDARRMVLMGHSAGAHLVALVGTDPSYARAAGFALDDIRGVIALDGAAYDVPAQISDGARIMHSTYLQAFGSDPARQLRLSPAAQAAAPNAAAFLLLHVDRDDGTRQTEALAAKLRAAGTPAQVRAIPGRGLVGHMEINRNLGRSDYPATAIVDDWLRTRL